MSWLHGQHAAIRYPDVKGRGIIYPLGFKKG